MRDRSQETLLGRKEPYLLNSAGSVALYQGPHHKARRPENWVFSAAAVSHPDPRERDPMDGGCAAGAEKYEQELRGTLADLNEHDDRFHVKIGELNQKRTQLEQRRERNRARWQQEIAELSRLESDLDEDEAALRMQWQQAFLARPLPVLLDHKDDTKNDNAWELSLMAWMMVVVAWFISVPMCDLFPVICFKHILVVFAPLWAFCSIVLSIRIFVKRFRWEGTLGQNTARLTSNEKLVCLGILLGTCDLYLLLRTGCLDDTCSGASSSSASKP